MTIPLLQFDIFTILLNRLKYYQCMQKTDQYVHTWSYMKWGKIVLCYKSSYFRVSLCLDNPILGGRYHFTSMGEPKAANTTTTATTISTNSTMSNNSTVTSTADRCAVRISKLKLLTQSFRGIYCFQYVFDSVILLFRQRLRILLHNVNICCLILFKFT